MNFCYTFLFSLLTLGLICMTNAWAIESRNVDRLHAVQTDGYEDLIRPRLKDNDGDEDDDDYDDDNELTQTQEDGEYEDENADKRDLIRGPSFIPTIDDEIAENDLDQENFDVLNKRKFIQHVGDNINTSKELDESSEFKKLAEISKKNTLAPIENEDEESNKRMSEHLIKMLYDWKKPEVLQTSHDAHTTSYTKKKNSIHTSNHLNTAVSELQHLFATVSDTIDRPIATENDVSDETMQPDGINIESHPESGKATVSTKKSKGKINVLVNVNINERPVRRSDLTRRVDIEYPHSIMTKEVDGTKKSGFLQQYGALQKLKEDEEEPESGSGELSKFSNNPQNITVHEFSGVAFPTLNNINIIRVVNGSDALDTENENNKDDEEENASENTSDEEQENPQESPLSSGSGESEDNIDVSMKKKDSPISKENGKTTSVGSVLKPLKHFDEKINAINYHKKYHPTHAYEEEAEAEKGETPDTVFDSKIVADKEEKEKELEHNDDRTEPVLMLKQKQNQETEKAIDDEVSKVGKLKSTGVSKTLDAETEDLASTVITSKLKATNTEDVGIEQLKEKVKPKDIPMDSAMEKPEETSAKSVEEKTEKTESKVKSSSEKNVSTKIKATGETEKISDSVKSGANEKEDEENDELLFTKKEKESKKLVDEKKDNKEKTSSEQKESITKKADNNNTNDDKYETLEEVREKFKTWENKIEKSGDKNPKSEASEGMEHIAKIENSSEDSDNKIDRHRLASKSETKVKLHQKKKNGELEMSSNVANTTVADEPIKSWKEEEKMLLEKLKNPFLSENLSVKFKDEDEDEDEEYRKKEKQLEKDAQEIAKSADKEFSSVVQKVTASEAEKAQEEREKAQQKEVKEFSVNADKVFSSVVNQMTSEKLDNAPEVVIGKNKEYVHSGKIDETKSESMTVAQINNSTSVHKNLKQLQLFKEQILKEVAKIDKLQEGDAQDYQSAQDLKQAKEVLQKDLKVVKNLERNLRAKAQKKVLKTAGKKVNLKSQFKKHLTVAFKKSPFEDKEIIPDAQLGFDGPKKKKIVKKLKKALHMKHPLEEIKSLLKAEIKRLKKNKGNKYDKQLILIRGLVQQKIKAIIANGDLDKAAFHKLGPDIKELGILLKARIKNEKKRKHHKNGGKIKTGQLNKQNLNLIKSIAVKKKPINSFAKTKDQNGATLTTGKKVDHQMKKVQNELNKVETITNNADKPNSDKPNAPIDLTTAAQHITNAQNAFQKIQNANFTLDPARSNQMKNLLNVLNQKLGEIYSKAQRAQSQHALQAQQQVQQQQHQINQQYGDNFNNTYMLMLPANPLDVSGQSSPMYIPQTYSQPQRQQQQQQLAIQDPLHQVAQGKHNLPIAPTTTVDAEIDADDNKKALADDEPVDTLVENLERDITEIWSYRDLFPDADSLGLDNEKVHNTYANLGSLSGLSLRRALNRALRGEDVGLAVVGGSISKGGPFSEKGLDFVLRSYFYAVEDYWNKIIRPVTGSSMIIRDVSIGGIATDYYSYCLQNHLPDDKLTNIILWELSANDLKRYEDLSGSKQQPLEQFTRNVLAYKAKPALIFVNFFALFDWDPDLSTHCRNFEDEGEDDIARYYKITSLSWRNMVCPLLRSGSNPLFTRNNLFSEDNFHPSILAHAQMSYIIIDYIRTEFLKNLVKMRRTFIADAVTRLQVPKSIYIPRPMFPGTYQWKPLCYTYMLVDNRQPNNTLPIDEENNGNFRYTIVREFKIRSDKIVGMETQNKDQFIRYRVHVPSHINGGNEPYKRLGIMTFTDDRYAQVQFDSEMPRQIDSKKKFLEGTVIRTIAENVQPGEHAITVRSGNNGFLICAIVLG